MHLVEEFSNRKIETFATDESVTHDTESVLHNNVCVSELLLNMEENPGVVNTDNSIPSDLGPSSTRALLSDKLSKIILEMNTAILSFLLFGIVQLVVYL